MDTHFVILICLGSVIFISSCSLVIKKCFARRFYAERAVERIADLQSILQTPTPKTTSTVQIPQSISVTQTSSIPMTPAPIPQTISIPQTPMPRAQNDSPNPVQKEHERWVTEWNNTWMLCH